MKTLIVYSSLTGNTKKVAEAIAAVLPGCDLLPVEEAPASVEGYDLVALGYWVDRGMPDGRTRTWLGGVKNARLAFFGTLGAWPDSDHAKECMKKGEELALVPERGNEVYGSWLCQGKIDPRVLEAMARMAGNVHPMTPERKARIEEAAKHPDEDDCRRAQAFFRGILEKMN
ncbi:flavodoxin family protein [uncultured Mailhella sp.]|uniref:flavodoxin family protein n=1 Tax=uncultured Mailhella sp. TaxID=1981031 RepID=UPI0025CEE1ED|nr:flavodoxin family protein [uncultured Mailhella sp.]